SEALESAAAALVGRVGRVGFAPGPFIDPSMSLGHSVDGDVRDGRQFHDRSFLRVGSSLRTTGPRRRFRRSCKELPAMRAATAGTAFESLSALALPDVVNL